MNEVNNIPEGWVETTLGKVVTFQRGFDLPTTDRTMGNFPLMVSNGQDGTHNEFKVKAPGIVTGRSGSLGNVYFVNKNFWPLNTTLWIKDFYNNDVKFVYYFLKTFPFKKYNSGSGVPTLNRNHIHPISIIFPQDNDEQKSIAAILTSFDDKIELLQAQNKTLEELAQTIFKEWFGKYKVGDEMPDGWRVGVIEDLTLKMNSGGTPSTKEESYYNGYINWFSTKELQDNFIFESDKKITEKGLNNSSTKLFPKDTVIMAIYAAPTVGRLGILNQESAFNQAAVGLIAKNKVGYPFVFLLLKYFRDEFNNLSNGAAQQNLNVGIVKNFKICIPNEESLNFFNKIQMPLFEKIRANSIQIQTLTKTRDALLPKLMSGEIRVKM